MNKLWTGTRIALCVGLGMLLGGTAFARGSKIQVQWLGQSATKITTPSGKVTWVDGGMLSNFPITVFDRTDGEPERWPTWGIKLSARPAAVQVDRPTGNDFQLAMSCLQTLMAGWDRYHLDDENVTQRTVFVDTGSMSATNFGITKQEQSQLFESGRSAATSFLKDQKPPTPARTIRT